MARWSSKRFPRWARLNTCAHPQSFSFACPCALFSALWQLREANEVTVYDSVAPLPAALPGLRRLERAYTLSLDNTALTSLDDLASLRFVAYQLAVRGNAQLESVAGLCQLATGACVAAALPPLSPLLLRSQPGWCTDLLCCLLFGLPAQPTTTA